MCVCGCVYLSVFFALLLLLLMMMMLSFYAHFDHGDPFYRVSRGEQLKDAGRPSHSCTGAFHHLDNDADEEGEDDEDVDDFGFVFKYDDYAE